MLKPVVMVILTITIQLSSSYQDILAQKPGPAKYADPFIGTDFFGHTYPGPALPFGLVHLSPDNGNLGWTFSSGYAWSSSSIMGFSHTHWSGVGMTSGGDILMMPTAGDLIETTPGPPSDPDQGYRSRHSHDDETAFPGFYSVILKDFNIKAELTATKRAGFHRYIFPALKNARVMIDLGHQIGSGNFPGLSELMIVNDTIIEGFRNSGMGKVWFCAVFSRPFRYYGTFDNDYKTPESGSGIFPYKSGESGKNIGAFVTFVTKSSDTILVKVGISYTSAEGARGNLRNEIPGWDFDKVRHDAEEAWNRELSVISIDGTTEEQRRIFYTAMYHSLLAQYITQDYDGRYIGSDGKVHRAEGYDYYGSFSCWDTYRSQHPVLTLIAPRHVNDFIRSVEAKTREYGWLPAQHFQNVFGEGMVGDHLIPVIADAWFKGFRDYDMKFLYGAMRKKALGNPEPPVPAGMGRSGLRYFMELGYIPVDRVTESVSKTLEMAYDDWCIAQIAGDLGKKEDYDLFMKRASYYRNLYDFQTGFMRPRLQNGSWLEEKGSREQIIVKDGDYSYYKYFDPLLVGRRPDRHYTESNAWQYLWSVQHDPQGLINLMGGRKEFSQKLDTFFSMSPVITPPSYVGVVGTIGQYVHGNQPSHHVAYLYNYAGEPWKTQSMVRRISTSLYRSGPGGLCGNEDMGSLSSWYIFSSLGFYPVAPGIPVYTLGSPLFGFVSLDTGNGKRFTITAKNNSTENKYIQSATLNGRPLTRTWISHTEIIAGGELVFEMGPEPNKKWGSGNDDIPPSMTPSGKK